MTRTAARTGAAIALSIAAAHAAHAQTIAYTGGTYAQSFDGLPTTGFTSVVGAGPHALIVGFPGATGVDGWYGGNPLGSSASTEFRAQDGSLSGNSGRGVISYGTAGSTDRALGVLATSNQISRIGALFVNSTAAVLTDVTITYTGEQWRRGNVATPNALTFTYGLGASTNAATTPFSALTFTAPNAQASPTEVALNGNAAANRTLISATITGLNWQPGQTLAIAWTANDAQGQDDGVAIDDLTLSAVPSPGALALLALGGLTIARRGR